MKFEWDENKNQSNLKKHGLSFEVAITAFDDPNALIADDEKHSTSAERRKWLIGESDDGVLVIVFLKKNRGRITRIVSARKANRKEKELYETYKGISFR